MNQQKTVESRVLSILKDCPRARFDDIDRCKELSMYDTGVSAEYGDKLITLSTCEYSQANSRLVVVAKKIVDRPALEAENS